MTTLRNILQFLSIGLIVAAIIVAAAGLPFVLRTVDDGTGPGPGVDQNALDECWGCAPFSRLIELFELQHTAATPRVELLEQRLEQRNMMPDARVALADDLALAQSRLAAADQALEVLLSKRDDCASNEACRLGPEIFQRQTCNEGWPNARLHNSLTRIADQAYSMGSQCRGLDCPVVNCSARGRLDSTMRVLLETLAQAETRTLVSIVADAAYEEYLEALKAHLEQLPLMLPDISQANVEEWREGLSELAVYEPAPIEIDVDGGEILPPPLSWRQRLLTRYLQQLEDFSAPDFGTLPPDSRAWWPSLVETTALALAQVRYLNHQPLLEIGACRNPRPDRLESLTASLRRASASLAVCGARGGCEAAEPGQILEQFDARETGTMASAADFMEAARTVMAEELAAFHVRESEAVTLSMELTSFGAGEAIGVDVQAEGNVCMAENGAWLGLFAEDAPDGSGATVRSEALARLALSTRVRETAAFLQAPLDAGNYEIRAFAPDTRGGAEMARAGLIVWPGPTSCEGFDGIWDTSFGELRMFVRGNDVRGTYRRSEIAAPGYFTGERQGRVLYGEWSSEIGRGGARLVLSADGTRFRGTWGQRAGQYAGTGQWNGSCIAGSSETPE